MMVLMLFPVKWPKSIKAFGVVLSWISLDFINFVSPSCLGTPLNYYWRFMLLVVGTAAIIVVPWLFSYIRHKHWRPDPAKWEGAVKARFRDTYLLVTLFHPTVSGQAFYHFRCQRVGNESYLMVDYTIKCYDATWKAMLVPILTVIVFFSVGLPLVFAVVLYRRRHMLDDPATRRLWGILYSSFKPALYFYDCINMEFKLILWAFLVFFDRGSQFQMAFATLLCFIQLGLHARYEPYKEPVKNWLQYVGFSVVTLTSFGGLVLNYLELYKEIAILQGSNVTVQEAQMQIDGFEVALAVAMWAGIILVVTRVLLGIAKFLKKNKAGIMQVGRKLRRVCCRPCGWGGSAVEAEAEVEVRVELGEITGPEVKVDDDEADDAAEAESGGDEAVVSVSTTASSGTQESALRPTNGSDGGESKRDVDLINPMNSGKIKSLGAFAKSRSKRVLRRLSQSEREGGAGEAAEAAAARRTIKAVETMEAVVTVEMEEQEPWLGGSRGSEDVPAGGDERKGEVNVDESEVPVLSSPPSPVMARESRLGRLERLKRLSAEV